MVLEFLDFLSHKDSLEKIPHTKFQSSISHGFRFIAVSKVTHFCQICHTQFIKRWAGLSISSCNFSIVVYICLEIISTMDLIL